VTESATVAGDSFALPIVLAEVPPAAPDAPPSPHRRRPVAAPPRAEPSAPAKDKDSVLRPDDQ
jgi:hypothetical protein